MRFVKSPSRKSVAAISLAVFSCLGSRNAWAQTQTSSWDGIADQTWENALNWTPSGVPNNNTNGFTDYNVAIGSASPTTLNSSDTIDSMTLGTAGLLNITGGNLLTLNGPTLALNGTLTVNSNQAVAVTSLILNNVTVSGGGAINLNDDITNTTATIDGTFTQSATNTIYGQGAINAALTNYGTVAASIPGHIIYLQNSDKINDNTFQATNNGTLYINNINITQGTIGQIDSGNTSTVILTGASINGGFLEGTGLIKVQGGGNSLTNISNESNVQIAGGQTLLINGNTTNAFQFVVNSDQAVAVTSIDFSGGSMSGGGVIELNDDATNTTATVDGTLTLIDCEIHGAGAVNAALINFNHVTADRLGHTLYMQTSDKINNGYFGAVNGATLQFDNINVSQSAAAQIYTLGGAGTVNQINLNSTAVTGGLVAISGPSILQMTSSSVLAGTVTLESSSTLNTISGTSSVQGLTSSGHINLFGGSVLNIIGDLADNGTITVNSDQAVAVTSISFNAGTLSGTGTLVLNDDLTNTTATLDGDITQAAGHTISGQGAINAFLTNNGTVNANLPGHLIFMQTTDKHNNNLFEATNGGTLAFGSFNVDQGTAGEIVAGTGSLVTFTDTNVIFGALNGTGLFQVFGSTALADLTNNSTVNIIGGATPFVADDLVNNGTIAINSDQAVAVTNFGFTKGTLSGSGVIILNSDYSNTTATLDGIITQSAGHTIRGQGAINALFTNNGLVNANLSGHTIFLQTSDKTNNNVLEATNGGTLSAVSINIIQGTAGQITAGSGSFVDLTNVALSNGTLNGSGLFTIESGPSSLTNVTNNATINEVGNQSLIINGSLSNSGLITVNSDQSFVVTGISFNGGSLFGTGTLALNNDATNTTATIDGSLTQSLGHTINGQGAINAALTNNGTVNANLSGHNIYLQTSDKINNNLFEATSGGTLAFSAINVVQGAAGQITTSGAGSLITLSNSSITGGLVSTATGGTLQFTDAASRITGNITNNGTVSVQGGSAATPVITGAITGNGALAIGSNDYLRLAPKPVASTFSSVMLNSNSTLDITTNRVVIKYGSPANDPVIAIATALKSGYNGGTWSGAGIDSSTAAANSTVLSVGYADGNTDSGTAAGPNQIVVKYTLAGDATLAGTVNFNDLVAVVQNFNKSGTDWAHGNFFYGPSTNFNDLVAVVQNFNKSPNPAATSGNELGGNAIPLGSPSIQSTDVQLPEPGVILFAPFAAAALLSRRKKSKPAN